MPKIKNRLGIKLKILLLIKYCASILRKKRMDDVVCLNINV